MEQQKLGPTDEQLRVGMEALKEIALRHKAEVTRLGRMLGSQGEMIADALLMLSLSYAGERKDNDATLDFWEAIKEFATYLQKVDLECIAARRKLYGQEKAGN